MRVFTRSKRVTEAIGIVRRRMPEKDRLMVEGFVARITANREWAVLGLDGFDSSSGVFAPLYSVPRSGRIDRSKYEAQIFFNLPIVRLFSDKAVVGIVAHEFAHARIAARIGEGWHEKMQARYRWHERAADSLAASWGFRREITSMRKERAKKVTPLLDRREPEILRAMDKTSRAAEAKVGLALESRLACIQEAHGSPSAHAGRSDTVVTPEGDSRAK